MKLTNIAIIFALITAVFFGIDNHRMSQIEDMEYVDRYYKKVLQNASEDAASTLKKRAMLNSQGLISSSEIEPEEVFNTFFRSFSLSLGIGGREEVLEIYKYFPVIAIIEDDGIILNSYKEYTVGENTYINRVIKPKLNFHFINDGVVYYPKLSGKVTCLYYESGVWREDTGYPEELIKTPFKKNELTFLKRPNIDVEIKKIIAGQISDIISEEITTHKKAIKNSLNGFDFYIPPETDGLTRAISGPTFIAIMQGYRPFDKSNYLNERVIDSIGLSRLEVANSDFYIGFLENGIRYYTKASEAEGHLDNRIEAFTSEIAAVKAGYYKWKK